MFLFLDSGDAGLPSEECSFLRLLMPGLGGYALFSDSEDEMSGGASVNSPAKSKFNRLSSSFLGTNFLSSGSRSLQKKSALSGKVHDWKSTQQLSLMKTSQLTFCVCSASSVLVLIPSEIRRMSWRLCFRPLMALQYCRNKNSGTLKSEIASEVNVSYELPIISFILILIFVSASIGRSPCILASTIIP